MKGWVGGDVYCIDYINEGHDNIIIGRAVHSELGSGELYNRSEYIIYYHDCSKLLRNEPMHTSISMQVSTLLSLAINIMKL